MTHRRMGTLLALMTAILLSSLFTPTLRAQDNKQAMARLEKISTALQLTPDQKKQVRPIIMEEAPKLMAIKNDTSMGKLQKAMKMKQISDETDAKLKPILTDAQYTKLQQMREQERQEMMQQKMK